MWSTTTNHRVVVIYRRPLQTRWKCPLARSLVVLTCNKYRQTFATRMCTQAKAMLVSPVDARARWEGATYYCVYIVWDCMPFDGLPRSPTLVPWLGKGGKGGGRRSPHLPCIRCHSDVGCVLLCVAMMMFGKKPCVPRENTTQSMQNSKN